MAYGFNEENLKSIFHNKYCNLSTGVDRITRSNFANDLDNHIEVILRKIDNSTYKFSRFKTIIKNDRQVHIPTIRDRLVIEVLKGKIKKKYRLKPSDRNKIMTDIFNLLNDNVDYYIIRLDLKQFFASVPIANLLDMIERNSVLSITEYSLLYQLYNNNEKGLIEGISISNYLSEFYLERFDIALKNIHPQKSYFARYVDDIILIFTGRISTKDKTDILNQLETQLSLIGLNINYNKFSKTVFEKNKNSDAVDFLGYSFSRIYNQNKLKVAINISENKMQKYFDRINRIFGKYFSDSDSELLYLRIQAFFFDHKILKTRRYINKEGELDYFSQKISYGITTNYKYSNSESFSILVNFMKRKLYYVQFSSGTRKYKNLIFSLLNHSQMNGIIIYSEISIHHLRKIVYKEYSHLTYRRILSYKKYELIPMYYEIINY